MPILPLNSEPEEDDEPISGSGRDYADDDADDDAADLRGVDARALEPRSEYRDDRDDRDDDGGYRNFPRERAPMRGRVARQQEEREAARLQLQNESRPQSNGSTPALDENNLLQRIHMGSEEALGEFYDRYGKMLYSVALRVLRDPSAAEDVLCDVYLDIWRNTENYLSIRGPLAGWLAVTVRNRSIDALRRKRPLQTLEDILLSSNLDLALESERNMLMEKARSVIQALPAEQRKTLEMAFFDGLTHVEISEMSGEKENVVKTRLRAALLTLRKAMQA